MGGPPAAVAATRVAVRRWIAQGHESGELGPGTPLTVACSGGADSMALLAATLHEGPRAGHPVQAVTVDHRLQDGSATRAAEVAARAHVLGCRIIDVRRADVIADSGPEADARTARYGVLGDYATEGWVLLGHTLDDQAETVLLGLGRGSGARSLAGMSAYRGRYGRPFLSVRRSQTEQACADQGIKIWNDPHNVDPRFTRVRLRREVLPLLEDVLGGGVAQALARTADQLRQDQQALDELAAPYAREQLKVSELQGLPAAIRIRAIKRWIGDGANAVQLVAVDDLVIRWRGQGPVYLPRGSTVIRVHDNLVIDRAP